MIQNSIKDFPNQTVSRDFMTYLFPFYANIQYSTDIRNLFKDGINLSSCIRSIKDWGIFAAKE